MWANRHNSASLSDTDSILPDNPASDGYDDYQLEEYNESEERLCGSIHAFFEKQLLGSTPTLLTAPRGLLAWCARKRDCPQHPTASSVPPS